MDVVFLSHSMLTFKNHNSRFPITKKRKDWKVKSTKHRSTYPYAEGWSKIEDRGYLYQLKLHDDLSHHFKIYLFSKSQTDRYTLMFEF